MITPGSPPPGTTPAGAPPAALAEASLAIQNVSYVLQHAFVAGQAVRVVGTAPNGCGPNLHLDGRVVGPVATTSAGLIDVGVATQDLAPGQHVAEVYCTNPSALLIRTVFWVAAPQSGSNVLFVVLSSVFILCALGWVALRTIAGPSVARVPVERRPGG